MARKKAATDQLSLGLDGGSSGAEKSARATKRKGGGRRAAKKPKAQAGPAERSKKYRPRSARTTGRQWTETERGIKKCWTVKDGPNKGKRACLTIEN
jgi:hypothetical protein